MGPLFVMDDVVREIYNLKNKEYIYRKKASGQLSTRFSWLADTEEGTAVKTFRKVKLSKVHMPVNIW